MSAAEALAGIRVADLSEGVSGQFCARLMADYGAEVTLVEPPEGTPTRRSEPRMRSAEGARSLGCDSALFMHLNAGKTSRVLHRGDTAELEGLLAEADIIVIDGAADAESVSARNPRAIVARITEFGAGVDPATICGGEPDEMIHQALSGIMYNNGVAGRQPLYGVGHRVYYVAGAAAYTGALAALFARDAVADGAGQIVDIAVAEVAASMSYNQANQFLQNGSYDARSERYTPETTLRCSDGFVSIFPYSDRWETVCTLLDAEHLIAEPRFATPAERQRRWREVDEALEAATITMTKDEVVGRLRGARQVAAQSARPTQLRRSAHLAARDFWSELETAAGTIPVLGPPFRMGATPRSAPRAAPILAGAEEAAR